MVEQHHKVEEAYLGMVVGVLQDMTLEHRTVGVPYHP